MACAICGRYPRGFGFSPDFIGIDRPRVVLCSMACQHIAARLKGMIKPNQHEIQAIDDAMLASGGFIDALNKTDLLCFTQAEYLALIEVIVTAFQDSIRGAYRDDPPF